MTLEEIAVLAGVSRATVSRVLNDQPRVSGQTRERVLQIMRERGYHPNAAARTLASRRSQTIGLIIPSVLSNLAAPYYALVMQGVTAACDERGYNLLLSPVSRGQSSGPARLIQGGLTDGLLISTASVGHDFLAWLRGEKLPFVLIGRDPLLPDINTTCADYERGGAMAAQHLIWLGYRRIATITGPSWHGGSIARRDGFLHALRLANISCPEDYVVEGDFDEHGGCQAMTKLLSLQPRPEAVFCAADLAAIGAMTAVHEAGLRVPDDVAIVGFDDIPLAASVSPPLTTVRQPITQIGFSATTMLIDILETSWADPGRSLQPQHIVLPTELVVRESCGQKQRFQAQRFVSFAQATLRQGQPLEGGGRG